MAKVLRVTRHAADERQLGSLQAAVTKLTGQPGPHEVVVHGETVANAQEVLVLAVEHGAAVVEAVLPLPMVAELTNPRVNTAGVVVVRAITERKLDETGNATFTFLRYERIVKVEVVTEVL